MAAADLITLAYFKTLFPNIANRDALLSTLITQASAMANRYCGRVFASGSYTEVYNMPPQDAVNPRQTMVPLLQTPITAVSAVLYDPTGQFSPGQALSYSFDAGMVYIPFINPAAALMTLGPVNTARALQISYTAGYACGTNVPDDLQMAIVIIVSYLFGRINANSFGIRGQFNEAGGLSATFELSIPQAAKDILSSYRLARF